MTSQSQLSLQFLLAAISIVEREFPRTLAFAANPTSPGTQPAAAPPANQYVSALQHFLYTRCFIHPIDSAPDSPTLATPGGDLTAALSHANTSRDQWDPYWNVTRTDPQGHLQVTKNGRVRVALPGQFVVQEGRDQAPRPGGTVTLFAARESISQQPGFYFSFGETLLDIQDDTASQVRFYWNVTDTTVPALLSLSTTALNRFQIPYRMKCLSRRELFPRVDAAVLYVHRRFFRITAQLMLDIHRHLAGFVGPHTPPLTCCIAPGLGAAEDPASEATYSGAAPDESFGTHRCRIIAEGIYIAQSLGLRARQDQLQEVCRHFERNGLSLDRPYLNPGSHADFYVPEEIP